MVRLTASLARIPVIKFRKGGAGAPSASSAAASAAAPSPAATPSPPAGQAAATMSTSAISDIDLPARYHRQPLSEEEINYINGGGINDTTQVEKPSNKDSPAIAVIKIPKGILIESGKRRKDVMTLNIVLKKESTK